MIASTASHHESRLAVAWAAAASALSGAIYGLGLARSLFEQDPQRLAVFGGWPGALGLAALGAAVAAAISLLARRLEPSTFPYATWSPIALALPLFSLLSPEVNLLRSTMLLLGGTALLILLLFSPPVVARSRPSTLEPTSHLHTMYPRVLPICLFLLLFALYLRTLAPAVGQADTFEFQVGVARLGIAHGSGYPLLMLIGRLFTLLPVDGTLAYRANLSSAFFAALAGVGVERLARRLGAVPLVAALGGLAFGVSPTLWSRAVEIEVFALNAALVAAILYLCLDLILPSARPAGYVAQSRISNSQTRLVLLAFLFGLSLTNHLTTLFLGPACLIAGISAVRHLPEHDRPAAVYILRLSSVALLCFLLGLSVYVYLPLRWPAVNHGQALSLAGFTNILTGGEAKGAFQWRLPLQDLGRYTIVWGKIAGEYGWAGLLLALLGAVSLLFASSALFLVFIVTYLGFAYFELAFTVADPSFSSYIIPLHLMAAVLMALGIQSLIDLMGRLRADTIGSKPPAAGPPSPEHTRGHTLTHVFSCLVLTGFCLLPLRSIWRTFPLVDRSAEWSAQRLGELMLNQPLAKGAAILADSQKVAPLDYLQIAEGRRPDLDIIVLPDEASYRAALDERLAAGQVVYLGRYLPGLGSAYFLRSVGPLAEVSTQPFTSTALQIQTALEQPTGAGINLAGYALPGGAASLSAAAPGELDLTLVWRAQTVPADNLLVSLRLIDTAGQAAWQSAGSVPVAGLYPTNAWRAGDVVADFYRVPIGASLAPGSYHLQVALLPPFAAEPASAWTSVAPVTILPPAQSPSPPHRLRDHLGQEWLLGYDVPEAVAPGSRFSLTLYWLRTAQSSTITTLGETRSIAAWPAGAIVPITYSRTAPASGDSIDLRVATGASARCGWLAGIASSCPLPSVRLAGQAAAEGAINFDNQILLNHARLDTHNAAAGGRVSLSLEWQALRSIGQDYTVFIHLLGPDGLVHGQVDSWPVSGTRATSGWAPGEKIPDIYTIWVPADAPAGAYSAEIGLYLLSSGERLPVLNADGAPVDDRLLLPGLQLNRP